MNTEGLSDVSRKVLGRQHYKTRNENDEVTLLCRSIACWTWKSKPRLKSVFFFYCKPANKREPYKVCQILAIAGTCVAGVWVIYSTHCWGTWEAHGAHTCRKGPWHLMCHISLMRQAPATQALGLMLRWLMAVKNTILLVEFLNIRNRMLLKSTVATICPKY